jgi:hypothetical protein
MIGDRYYRILETDLLPQKEDKKGQEEKTRANKNQ